MQNRTGSEERFNAPLQTLARGSEIYLGGWYFSEITKCIQVDKNEVRHTEVNSEKQKRKPANLPATRMRCALKMGKCIRLSLCPGGGKLIRAIMCRRPLDPPRAGWTSGLMV